MTVDLSMFKPKARDYQCLGPSTVADATTFSNSCPASPWIATRYKPKPDSDFIARYQLKHTAVLSQTVDLLRAKYPNAVLETEVPLSAVKMCGNTLFGAADLILHFDDSSLIIADAKSGKRKQNHWIQVALYGVMLQGMARAKDQPIPSLRGFILGYGDGEGGQCELLSISGDNPLDEILPEPTRERIRKVLSESGQKQMPEPQPSAGACRFCKWKQGCDVAFEENSVLVDATDLLNHESCPINEDFRNFRHLH